MTLIHRVKINKQEANVAACPEKCLKLSFLNVFRSSLFVQIVKNLVITDELLCTVRICLCLTIVVTYFNLSCFSYFFQSEKACQISQHQLIVALRLRNPVLAAQCKVFAALSLIQRGQLKLASRIIRFVNASSRFSCSHYS